MEAARGWFLKNWPSVRGPIFKTFREVLLCAAISLFPVFAGFLLAVLVSENHSVSGAIFISTSKGDLFILATAALAPLILYLTVERGNLPRPLTLHFPGGWFVLLIMFFIFVTAAVLFTIKRLSEYEVIQLKYDGYLFQAVSSYLYLIALVVALIVTFIKYNIDRTSAEILRESDHGFIDKWLHTDWNSREEE